MTATQFIEYRITRQLLQRRSKQEQQEEFAGAEGVTCVVPSSVQIWADRLIAILALTACLLVLGSYIENLLWVLIAAATAFTLRG
jgi:hypothetical protein